MTRRALLIGSQTYGLRGCDADVALMQQVLASRGFDAIDVRTGSDASRAGIIAGLDALVAAIAPGDAVVVYYSGHGGRVVRPDFEARRAAGLSVHFHFIVPHDMDESAPGDFRGLLSEELTVHQRRLTDAFGRLGEVPNVTTILDCCHSGYMARALDTTAKSVDLESKMFRMRGVREHAQQLGTASEHAGAATNPNAVRLVACEPEQSAFEFPSARGGRHGALTDALASVLEELGTASPPWSVVGDLVRRRVRALVPEQRPEIEGPSDRLLFSTESMPSTHAMPVAVIDGVAVIEGARILGVAVDDEFELVQPSTGEAIGTAVVSSLTTADAVLAVTPTGAVAAVQGSAVAVPTRVSVPSVQVHLDGPAGTFDALREQLRHSTRLGISATAVGTHIRVRKAADRFVVDDCTGVRWRTADHTDDDAGRESLVEVLESIAVGHRLLDLASGDGPNAMPPVVRIRFGVVDGSKRRELALHGERLPAGTKVSLVLSNTGPDPLFVWVFDVGVSGRSSLVTNAAPSGTMLGAAGAEDDTVDVWGSAGEALFWPPDVPTDGAGAGRPETFVVLSADRRSDLSSLASSRGSERGMLRSPLDAIIAEARTGVREVASAGAEENPLRYRLDRIEFVLTPM